MKNNTIYSDAWCNLVFEGRNKAYGAYMLRREVEKNTLAGILTSLGICMLIFGIPLLLSGNENKETQRSVFKEIVFDIYDMPEKIKPAWTQKVEKSVIKNTERIDFKNTMEHKTQKPPTNPVQGITIPGLPTDSIFIDEGLHPHVEEDSLMEDNKVYLPAGLEVFPEFPGGEKAMMNFFRNQIKYPHEAYLNDKKGIVYLSFIIGKDGHVSEINVLKGVKDEESFEREAIRVTKLMPPWIPGKQNGKEVAVRYTLPFTFEIK